MGTVTFTFEQEDRTINEEDARWLLGQVRSAPVLTEAASSAMELSSSHKVFLNMSCPRACLATSPSSP